ncbi:MAG: hypothetical protein KY445_02140 [Armatimonadetes bacterium]|nr:hypothetical protein [Armatimonadota bacterium]
MSLKQEPTLSWKRLLLVSTRGALTALAATALSLAWTHTAHAQAPAPTPAPNLDFSVPTSAFIVPSLGQNTLFTESQNINIVRSEAGPLLVRPIEPESDSFSTSLEYETWDSGVVQGFNRVSGDRVTGLFHFVRGRRDDTEVSLTVPIQNVSIDNLGSSSGIGDVRVAFRKYFFNVEDPEGLTIVASLRGSISTGSETRAIGLGRSTAGPSLAFYKPFSNTLMVYGGGGIDFSFGSSLGLRLKNTPYGWFGAVNRFSERFGIKAEANFFNSAFDESYARIMIAPQLYLSPTQIVQLSLRRELRAVGRPTAISVGYSSQF